jgi:hypothetical protein
MISKAGRQFSYIIRRTSPVFLTGILALLLAGCTFPPAPTFTPASYTYSYYHNPSIPWPGGLILSQVIWNPYKTRFLGRFELAEGIPLKTLLLKDVQSQREVRLEPYQDYAVGSGFDEKGYYMAIVLVNTHEKIAKANVMALKEQKKQSTMSLGIANTTAGTPWPDIINRLEVKSRGRLTLAKLYDTAAFYWKAFDLGSIYEPLLTYNKG